MMNFVLAAKKKDASATPQHDTIADTSKLEAEIDRLVYKLYGLMEEEIKIVEGR